MFINRKWLIYIWLIHILVYYTELITNYSNYIYEAYIFNARLKETSADKSILDDTFVQSCLRINTSVVNIKYKYIVIHKCS